jgi:hypothetical protein
MTTKIKGTEGVEFPDSTVQGSAAYTKAQADAAFLTPAELFAAFTGSNQSLVSDSGYQKFPGGLIVQWGAVYGPGDSIVTFPIAFPTAALSITATMIGTSPSTEALVAMTDGLAASGVIIRKRFVIAGSVGSAAQVARYIAIGY